MTIIGIIEKATLDQRSDSARALRKPRSPGRSTGRLLKMAARALERADQAAQDVAAVLPPPEPIACGPGCPYCCHIRVTASAPEVLLVLSHIAQTWDEATTLALRRKVKNIDGLTRGLNDDERAKLRLPCPLLKDGSCAVHAVRPLSCRGLASVNLSACKTAYASHMAEGVPLYEPQYQAANAVGYGLYAGLVDAGFAVENIELVAALAIGLENSDIAASWLRGEHPFTNAQS